MSAIYNVWARRETQLRRVSDVRPSHRSTRQDVSKERDPCDGISSIFSQQIPTNRRPKRRKKRTHSKHDDVMTMKEIRRAETYARLYACSRVQSVKPFERRYGNAPC